jgi:hypothetical protein
MKERVDAVFDFGFTTTTEEDIIKNTAEQVEELMKLVQEMYDKINPLLKNLMVDADTKPVIHWPNRKEKIELFRKSLEDTLNKAKTAAYGSRK